MPKAAAMRPDEWATVHSNFEPFDLAALNRVVIAYAAVELANAERWHRRTALGRVCAGAGYALTILGLMAAVTLPLVLLTGSDGPALALGVYVLAGLGCFAVLGLFVPWVLSPYRQWDRTLAGIAVMVIVFVALALLGVALHDFEYAPRWALAVPCLVTLLVAVGALVGDYRLHSAEKPPAVDLASLTPEEIELLRKLRHKALKVLRSRGVVSYPDFRGFDGAPLEAPATESA